MSAIRTALLSAATVLALVPSAGAADDPAAKKVELKKGDKVQLIVKAVNVLLMKP